MLTIDKERARWTREDGSSAVWAANGMLLVRLGVSGPYKTVGKPGSLAYAIRLLQHDYPGGWRKHGGRVPVYRWHEPPKEVGAWSITGCVNVGGLWVKSAGVASVAAKLGRVAAYAARARQLEASAGPSPAGSLFDQPLTLGEVVEAIKTVPPDVLSDSERAAALAELTQGVTTEESDHDDGDDDRKADHN